MECCRLHRQRESTNNFSSESLELTLLANASHMACLTLKGEGKENIGEMLLDFDLGNDFLGMTSKAQAAIEKINNLMVSD